MARLTLHPVESHCWRPVDSGRDAVLFLRHGFFLSARAADLLRRTFKVSHVFS